MGFTAFGSDSSMFFYKHGKEAAYLHVYVDAMQLCSSSAKPSIHILERAGGELPAVDHASRGQARRRCRTTMATPRLMENVRSTLEHKPFNSTSPHKIVT